MVLCCCWWILMECDGLLIGNVASLSTMWLVSSVLLWWGSPKRPNPTKCSLLEDWLSVSIAVKCNPCHLFGIWNGLGVDNFFCDLARVEPYNCRLEYVVGAHVHFGNSSAQLARWFGYRQPTWSHRRNPFLTNLRHPRDPRHGWWMAFAVG